MRLRGEEAEAGLLMLVFFDKGEGPVAEDGLLMLEFLVSAGGAVAKPGILVMLDDRERLGPEGGVILPFLFASPADDA